jgi:hypothetical protein
MLAEIISFGGYVKERRKHTVRLGKPDAKKHIVIIKTAERDPKTGKIVYGTVESIDVYESNDAEVKEAVVRGLNSAVKK